MFANKMMPVLAVTVGIGGYNIAQLASTISATPLMLSNHHPYILEGLVKLFTLKSIKLAMMFNPLLVGFCLTASLIVI